VKAVLPELPGATRERFVAQHGVTPYDAAVLTGSRELSDYFEAAARGAQGPVAKLCANWVAGALSARLNEAGIDITASRVAAAQLRRLVERIADGTVSGKIAKDVFEAMWSGEAAGDEAADTIIAAKGLEQISDSGALEKIADEVIAANGRQVADYRSGKEKAFNSLVGQVMKATRGKANPQQVTEILKRKLAG
jgi:aspartyl-tRNA(Asn)/glutamyl-tRNA(Gln) amidotransferase subunit B